MKKLFKCAGIFMVIAFTGFALLTGCSGEKTLATGETRTVEWFKEHPEERKAVLEECANNPRGLADMPNCQNAEKAQVQSFIGTNGPIDWK